MITFDCGGAGGGTCGGLGACGGFGIESGIEGFGACGTGIEVKLGFVGAELIGAEVARVAIGVGVVISVTLRAPPFAVGTSASDALNSV